MKKFLKMTDMPGKNINKEKKVTLFYICDDVIIERRIVIE